jgi:hypothetical protein
MDPGFYEDLTGRIYGLLIVLEDSLSCGDVPVFTSSPVLAMTPWRWRRSPRTVAHLEIGITVREHAGVLALAGLAGVLARANQAPPASEFVRELAAHG